MYAMKLTRDVFEICLTMDPAFDKLPAAYALDTYVVFDSKNRIKYVIPADKLNEFFEVTTDSFSIQVYKVEKK